MRILSLLLLLLSLNLIAQDRLSKSQVAEFQKEITTKTNDLQSLEANFIQTKRIKMITGENISKGKLYYKAPKTLKWEYAEPKVYELLFIDGELHLKDVGEKSRRNLGSNKLFDKMAKLITGSVNGKLLQDNESFEVSYSRCEGKVQALIIPKDAQLQEMFSEIHLLFNTKKVVEKVSLMEQSGDATIIDFKDIKVNQPIPDSIFNP
ncbi:outer membrane lipoprotein carrier protein [Salegentibacter echinorum]|uniref:Outer membrane lipoprotein carrier protein n=1 Tax=Salegentibacter echinorum TaxID=1073325 RepID=A0A1M5FU28_SALEC|nr:outer membrane lipoprotein carrier protein LolA [Salegentibacter echinorum]SHF94929.1 outer membrane lipoprotein carrier protein [Salegentibacter echinorum]